MRRDIRLGVSLSHAEAGLCGGGGGRAQFHRSCGGELAASFRQGIQKNYACLGVLSVRADVVLARHS